MSEVKDQWCDPYPVERSTLNGKPVSELPVFATQVIDGEGYRIIMPPDGKEGFMRTVCIGPVKVVDGKAVILEKPEKQITDTPLTSISHAQDIDVAPVKLSYPIETTLPDDFTPVNFTRKNRALRKELPEDEIKASTEPSRVLADRFGVSHTTIAKIRKGQRVLV